MLDVDVVNEILDPEEPLEGGGKGRLQLGAHGGSMVDRGKDGDEEKDVGEEAHDGEHQVLVKMASTKERLAVIFGFEVAPACAGLH